MLMAVNLKVQTEVQISFLSRHKDVGRWDTRGH